MPAVLCEKMCAAVTVQGLGRIDVAHRVFVGANGDLASADVGICLTVVNCILAIHLKPTRDVSEYRWPSERAFGNVCGSPS
jgi:hypothetical protein